MKKIKNKKDVVAKIVILYMLPFLFWFGNRNSIHTSFDYYLFIFAFSIMCVIPIVYLLFSKNIYKVGES